MSESRSNLVFNWLLGGVLTVGLLVLGVLGAAGERAARLETSTEFIKGQLGGMTTSIDEMKGEVASLKVAEAKPDDETLRRLSSIEHRLDGVSAAQSALAIRLRDAGVLK